MKHSKHTSPNNPKTVFILGAGFSRGAGFPLQKDILNLLGEQSIPNLMDLPYEVLNRLSAFQNDVKRAKTFIDSIYENGTLPQLEDIFTILDQSIGNKKSCREMSWKELFEVDIAFRRSILFLFHNLADQFRASPPKLYLKIGQYFAKRRLSTETNNRKKFSIISLNWDDLLEETIFTEIKRQSLLKKMDVDYCCYTVPLDASTPHITSFHQKPKKVKNIKFLKLHGSVNWLICPSCERIFTGLGSKISRWEQYSLVRQCSCASDKSIITEAKQLQPFFITPTYLKNLGNAHIQSIWNNAFIEISEATNIVFIGYSFPESDFFVRSLLKRATNKNTNINVILTKNDKPKEADKFSSNYPTVRYKNFFGDKKVRFHLTGVEKFFETMKKIES